MRTKFFSLLVASLVILPFQAFARECTYSSIGNDDFVKITFNEASVEFQLHESSFVIPESKYKVSANNKVITIPKRSFRVSSEGTTFSSKISGRIEMPKGKKLIVDLNMGGTVIAKKATFNCEY